MCRRRWCLGLFSIWVARQWWWRSCLIFHHTSQSSKDVHRLFVKSCFPEQRRKWMRLVRNMHFRHDLILTRMWTTIISHTTERHSCTERWCWEWFWSWTYARERGQDCFFANCWSWSGKNSSKFLQPSSHMGHWQQRHHADQLRDISKDNETQIIAVRDEFQTLLQKMRDELAQERSSAVSQLHPQPELLDGESRRPAAQPNAANSGPPPHPPSATPCGFGTTDASTPLFGLVGPPPISASSAFGPTTVNGPPTLSALPSYGYRPPEINAQSGQHVNNAPWSYPANNHPHHTQQAIPHSGYAPPSYFGIAQTAGGAAYNAFIAMSNANAAAFANTMQSNNNMNSLNNMFNANYALFNAAMNNNHRWVVVTGVVVAVVMFCCSSWNDESMIINHQKLICFFVLFEITTTLHINKL